VPELKDPSDSSNFEEVGPPEEGADPLVETTPAKKGRGFQGNNLPFIGFSFNRRFKYGVISSTVVTDSSFAFFFFFFFFLPFFLRSFIISTTSVYLQESGETPSKPPLVSATSTTSLAIATANETSKKLQEELEQLQSKLSRVEKELDAAKSHFEQQSKRVTTLETTNKNLLGDLNEMTEQLTKSHESLA